MKVVKAKQKVSGLMSVPALARQLGIDRFKLLRALKRLAAIDREEERRPWLVESKGKSRTRYAVHTHVLFVEHPEYRSSPIVTAEEHAHLVRRHEKLVERFDVLASEVRRLMGEMQRRDPTLFR